LGDLGNFAAAALVRRQMRSPVEAAEFGRMLELQVARDAARERMTRWLEREERGG
jgi:hypothetical protein